MGEKKISLNEFYEMKVKDVMEPVQSGIPCITDKADVEEVFTILNNKDHLWVVDSAEHNQLLGVITESDTIVLFSPPVTSLQSFEKPDTRSLQYGVFITAEEIMSKKPVTTSPNEKIRNVFLKMREQKIKQLPVVDKNDVLLGEITLHHLITIYQEERGVTISSEMEGKNS
jgi:predicted transcriptional regulator